MSSHMISDEETRNSIPTEWDSNHNVSSSVDSSSSSSFASSSLSSSSSSSSSSLSSSLSSGRGKKMRGVTGRYCTGCDDKIDDKIVLLHRTRRQSHGLCSICMAGYLRTQFEDRSMQLRPSTKIACCGNIKSNQSKCKYELELLEGKLSSDEERLRLSLVKFIAEYKLERLYLRIIALNLPGAVICIECSEVMTDVESDDKSIICPSCSTSWCRRCKSVPYHVGNYCHRDGALAAMYAGVGGEEMREKIQTGIYRLCPNCNEITEKIDGCNKMTCATCNVLW